MEQLISAATIIVIFVLGAFFASLLSTGRLQTYFSEMSRSMLGYTLLGVALFLAVWILGPWGLAVVLVPVVLYQAIGVRQRARDGQDVTPPLIHNLRRWLPRWLGGYPKAKPEPAEPEQVEPAPAATEPEEPKLPQTEPEEIPATPTAE